jgi:hypothetical protein
MIYTNKHRLTHPISSRPAYAVASLAAVSMSPTSCSCLDLYDSPSRPPDGGAEDLLLIFTLLIITCIEGISSKVVRASIECSLIS